MSQKPHLVILSYNHPEITARSVKSVLNHVPSSKITLIHNGSLSRHVDALQKSFPEVEHLVLAKNMGYAGGANRGLQRGFEHAPWVLFLTNDCELRSLPVLPDSPALVGPIAYYDQNCTRVSGAGGVFDAEAGALKHFSDYEQFNASLLRGDFVYVPGAAFLMNREVFERVGGFDETLFCYWEDVDYSQRVRITGDALSILPEFKVIHVGGKTCRKDSRYTVYYYQRNRRLISWKYAEGFEKIKLAGQLLKSWAGLGYRLAEKRRWADLKLLLKATSSPPGAVIPRD